MSSERALTPPASAARAPRATAASGRWLEEALARLAGTASEQAAIRRGALLSLEARARFWSGVQNKIVRWRQPLNVHLRTQSHRGHGLAGEGTLEDLRAEPAKDSERRAAKRRPRAA